MIEIYVLGYLGGGLASGLIALSASDDECMETGARALKVVLVTTIIWPFVVVYGIITLIKVLLK